MRLEIRFRYNPDVQSIVAMGPAMIPRLLLMIPAVLSALAVVREKELGSIVNFCVTPQTAALFATAVLTMLPASQFSGLIDPVSSLEGLGALIGAVYPTTHFLRVARGIFSKGLGFGDLHASFASLAVATPVLVGLAAALLRKQAR